MRQKVAALAAGRRLEVVMTCLVCIGLLLLLSASRSVLQHRLATVFIKQLIWAVAGAVIFIAASRVDYRVYRRSALLLYPAMVAGLILVLIIGTGRAGRWIEIGPFSIQPSEFAKLLGILTFAAYLAERDPRQAGDFIGAVLIAGVPFCLIFVEPNLGTAMIFMLIALFMLVQQGVSRRQVAGVVALVAAASPVLWFLLKEYQRMRILTFLRPGLDPTGAGYNLYMSKIAIGTGGLIGKGFFRGTMTKFAFLPEYHTDFIFSSLAEQFGFLGVGVLFLLYYLLLMETIRIMASTRDSYARLACTGIFAMFFCQAVINIGMTLGLLPVVGIPLPFLSYGGSSLLVSMAAVGILASIRDNATMLF